VKCLEKKDKYAARERTGPNVVKLENVRLLMLQHKLKLPGSCVNAATTITATYYFWFVFN